MALIPTQLRKHLDECGPWVLGVIYLVFVPVVLIALCAFLISTPPNSAARWIAGVLLLVAFISWGFYALKGKGLGVAKFVTCSLLIAPFVAHYLFRIPEPQLYRIVVLGPSTPGAENADVWNDVDQGIREGLAVWKTVATDSPLVAGRTVDVQVRSDLDVRIDFLDDGGTVDYATKTLEGLVTDPNVLLVIGHCQSSVAIGVRRIYVSEMLPLITPAVTAEAFTAGNDDRGIRHIYRVCPTDTGQARIAANFALNCAKGGSGSLRIAMFRDGSNAEYSTALANAFRTRAEIAFFEAQYVLKVIYDGTIPGPGGGVFVTDSVVMFEPQLIVCIGMSDVAVPLIWQTRQMQLWWKRLRQGSAQSQSTTPRRQPPLTQKMTEELDPSWNPPILLTDGAVTLAFQRAAHDDMGKIYATFPEKAENDDGASYAPFGYDAIMVALTVLKETSDISRKGVTEKLYSLRDSVIYEKGRTGEIQFGVDGNRKNLHFHVLELRGKKFVHSVTRCSCKGDIPRD